MRRGDGPGSSPWRVWADLARAGNFPSVASNVVAALVLSSTAAGEGPTGGTLAVAGLAGLLAYAGGATLNDVADARFDAAHRPERPIPRQVVSRNAAGWLGGLQLLAGGGLLIALGASPAFVALLLGVIVAYDLVHKRWSSSVVLMGGCRALLALALASLPGHEPQPAFVIWLVALFAYIVGLSLIARREYTSATAGPQLGRLVGRMLALIPLLDAVALLAIGAGWPALACAAAYPLGRWAQRMAAST